MGVRSALITGITGQDGSYLAELLLQKGYKVYGVIRRSSIPHTLRIAHLLPHITLIPGDLLDITSLINALELSYPDEIYNLAAMSHVGESFKQPLYTWQVNAMGALNVLEAVRQSGIYTKIYQASTSELFGRNHSDLQNEMTPFYPRSPYGVSKLTAYWNVVNYREAYDLFACNGILFNHESPRRGEDFVTRKISMGVARIKLGLQSYIQLGNLDASRDWGFAGDYVDAMWRMLQLETPKDYVIATGETHTVREFVEKAFAHVGIDDWQSYVICDQSLKRPSDVEYLAGDASEARKDLLWTPRVTFRELVGMMVDYDLRSTEDAELAKQWKQTPNSNPNGSHRVSAPHHIEKHHIC